jgi:hypothetical protein
MRPGLDRPFWEGLVRHASDSSCREIEDTSKDADGPAALGKTSSTVRERERAGIGVVGESLLLSPENGVGSRTDVMEEDGVEDGRRIRYAVSAENEALIEARGGSGFVTVTPVALGDNGDAIIGAGIVRRLR